VEERDPRPVPLLPGHFEVGTVDGADGTLEGGVTELEGSGGPVVVAGPVCGNDVTAGMDTANGTPSISRQLPRLS
jgi:hypothetical protein